MNRAARILLNAAAGVSVLLFVATAMLCAKSYRSAYALTRWNGPAFHGFQVSRGELMVLVSKGRRPHESPLLPAQPWVWSSGPAGDLRPLALNFFPGHAPPVAGFLFARRLHDGLSTSLLLLPLPFLLLLLAPLPLANVLLIRRRRRQKRRLAAGLCVRCGYDLRATPDKCPE